MSITPQPWPPYVAYRNIFPDRGSVPLSPEDYEFVRNASAELTRLTAENAALKKERDEVRADFDKFRQDQVDLEVGKITLNELALRNGTLTAAFGTEMAHIIASQFSELLKEKGGPNYLEMQFTSRGEKDKSQPKRIILTLRWEDGKTPNELRLEAESALILAQKRVVLLGEAVKAAKRMLPTHICEEAEEAYQQCEAALALTDAQLEGQAKRLDKSPNANHTQEA